jgi:hypothetical protein
LIYYGVKMLEEKFVRVLKGDQEIVINKCHGGFGLSIDAVQRYLEIKNIPVWSEFDEKYSSLGLVTYWLVPPDADRLEGSPDNWHSMSLQQRRDHNAKYEQQVFTPRNIARDDPALVQVVKELDTAANGSHAELKVVSVPADVEWEIDEYDGLEWVAEKHRTWE